MRIALDFDGVLHDYQGWIGAYKFHPPVRGAQGFCWQLLDAGHELSIFTSRVILKPGDTDVAEDRVQAIRTWLLDNKFPPRLAAGLITGEKVHADVYIDDRAYRFDGNFSAALQHIAENPRPWNRLTEPRDG